MKTRLFACTAVAAALSAAPAPVFAADDQTPSTPAGTRYEPAPTVAEELVYLRDIIALQTLRLDEAEQALARQRALIEAQAAKLSEFETAMRGMPAMMQAMVSGRGAGEYVVESGDTLGAIASRFGMSVGALAAANDLRAPYPLRSGQRLAIPGAAPATISTPSMVASAPVQQPAAPLQQQAQAGHAQTAPAAAQAPAQPTAQPPSGDAQRVAAAQISEAPQTRPEVTERALNEQRRQQGQTQQGQATSTSGPQEVGVRPEDEGRPYVAIFSDVAGVLTPRGTFYVEPSVDYTVTSDNRFFFQGVEIIDAILIGAIEATDSDRRAVTESLAFRYGVTNRLEIDGRVSYITRRDRISGVAIDDATTSLRELDGSGFGDAEIGLHYQINKGRNFPYTVANIRAKAPTGLGPFEVARSPVSGIELELPTGSGYWTIEPSLTFILPTDPAVIFANVGYQYNMPTSPNAVVGTTRIVDFDAGDAIRTSIGIGLSINDRLSINFGYDQSQFFRTRTVIEAPDASGNMVLRTAHQPATTVGSFLFGGAYTVNDWLRLNLNTSFGATDEAPDMRVTLRANIRVFD